MEAYEVIKNRQMDAMLTSAREKLKKYKPEDICRKGKVVFEDGLKEFFILSMGQIIKVSYPDYAIAQKLEMWHYLTILQYLDTADGTELSGEWIGLQQLRGGISRGHGYDKDIATMFERYFTGITKSEFLNACIQLGGRAISGKADVSVVIWYAPMFPVLVNFWEADDEFSASGKILIDANAEHYLKIEAAGGACSAVVQKIHEILIA